MTKEDTAIEISKATVQRMLKEWKGVLSCMGLGFALYYQRMEDVSRVEENFKALSERVDRYYLELHNRVRVGPGGFIDPQVQAGLDAFLRSSLREYTTDMETTQRRWRKQLSELNPTMKMPAE